MNEYKPASRPAAFGAVAVALTAMTVALAVVLPATMEAGSRDVRSVAAPSPVSGPAADLDSGPIRIDAIASRNPSMVQAHTRLNAPRSRQQGSERLGTRAVAGPDRLGGADAGYQRALCPYLTKGTVAATS
jgi:hypothetical protein